MKSLVTPISWGEISGIKVSDEYSLHHEYSQTRIDNDRKCVKRISSYISERGNPFNTNDEVIKNRVTGAPYDQEATVKVMRSSGKSE